MFKTQSKMLLTVIITILVAPPIAFCLGNGLALTPPMGWLSWERFRCNTDCAGDPEFCIGENLFRDMADMMVAGGYLDVGYNTVIVDDCWLDHKRSAEGRLQPDPERFPNGIPALANYIHKLGLKFGLYEDYGNLTCGGYPGVLQNMQLDARTFADWGVDYVKLDGCYSDPSTMDAGYPEFGKYLNATGRPMVYSCSWPAYQIGHHPDYALIAKHCNLWRNFADIEDSWGMVLQIVDYYGDDKDGFGSIAGPGHWNDPDMLIIGNFGLSLDQSKAQMAMWCMFAAPLIMSADLRTIRPEFQEILLNRNLIRIDQDPMGVQARRIIKEEYIHVFTRPIMPGFQGNSSMAVAFLNRYNQGTPLKVKYVLQSLGLTHPAGYQAYEAFSGAHIGLFRPTDTLFCSVNPTGVFMVRFEIIPQSTIEHGDINN